MKYPEAYIPKKTDYQLHGNLAVFEVPASEIVSVCDNLYNNKKLQLKLIDASDEHQDKRGFVVWYVFGIPKENRFIAAKVRLKDGEELPSVTQAIHAAGAYERKLSTLFGITPVGTPDTRPTLLHENWPESVYPLRKDFKYSTRPKVAKNTYKFQRVKGEGVYEIPVGPIHAGIIEPGHFRFSMAGEEILLLEPRLGYVHKGSEKLFEKLSVKKAVKLAEKISGDSSFSHSLAFCQAVEDLANVNVPKRAQYLRVVFAELERLANHFGDIGAIMLDTGFNFGGANGARLREHIMQINELVTGSRFLRGVNTVGGVNVDIPEAVCEKITQQLAAIAKDFNEVVEIAENSTSLQNRLKETGPINRETAEAYGAVGIAARAVGINVDTRHDYPYATYSELELAPIALGENGDVYSRFEVRIEEARGAIETIIQALSKMPSGGVVAETKNVKLRGNSVSASCVEGWRGEIFYLLITDKAGELTRVALRDPSFINWQLLGHAGAGQMIPDFPLINKSFNLSYTGNDL